MKKLLMVTIGIAMLGISVSRSANATVAEPAAQAEEVACYDYLKGGPSFKKKPTKCVFMKNGESAGAYSVYVEDMKSWKHWGAPKTKVEGTARANMGFATPVKVRLSKIQDRCGRRVYTKARFEFPKLDGHSSFRLYPC